MIEKWNNWMIDGGGGSGVICVEPLYVLCEFVIKALGEYKNRNHCQLVKK